MILAAKDLAFGYRGRAIGSGVSLEVRPGEVFALLGPNGGGKTTLLKTLLGLLAPVAGNVMLDGQSLATLPIRQRARLIGYVPQAHAGTFAFAVREVVLMGRTAHLGLFASPSAKDREVAERILDGLGLHALADKPYTQISGGERQLVLVARALAQQPRLVILDEPTASLDFGNQGKVMRRIGELAGQGLGVLFTTHDPNQALRHASRVGLLSVGQLSACGTPDDILTVDTLSALYRAGVEKIEAFVPTSEA